MRSWSKSCGPLLLRRAAPRRAGSRSGRGRATTPPPRSQGSALVDGQAGRPPRRRRSTRREPPERGGERGRATTTSTIDAPRGADAARAAALPVRRGCGRRPSRARSSPSRPRVVVFERDRLEAESVSSSSTVSPSPFRPPCRRARPPRPEEDDRDVVLAAAAVRGLHERLRRLARGSTFSPTIRRISVLGDHRRQPVGAEQEDVAGLRRRRRRCPRRRRGRCRARA